MPRSYPLFGQWAKSIISFADANHDGIIEADEIRYSDTLMYIGEPVPNFETNFYTDVALFGGRVSAHATFAYTNGLTQFNHGGIDRQAPLPLLAQQPDLDTRDPGRGMCSPELAMQTHKRPYVLSNRPKGFPGGEHVPVQRSVGERTWCPAAVVQPGYTHRE